MRKPILLLLSLSSFLLQGCLTVTTQDIVRRSTSQLTLPSALVHVPVPDSGDWVQGSVAVSGTRERWMPVSIDSRTPVFSSDPNASTRLEGPASLEFSRLNVAAEVSMTAAAKWSLGLGMNASPSGGAGWLEVGRSFGWTWPIEITAAVGGVSSRNEVEWTLKTHSVNRETEKNDSTSRDSIETSRGAQVLYRLGIHAGRRAGGPWIEAQLGSVDLFDCIQVDKTWGYRSIQVGTGWLQRTGFGDWIVFVRGTNAGKSWLPSAGIQWTGDFKLSR